MRAHFEQRCGEAKGEAFEPNRNFQGPTMDDGTFFATCNSTGRYTTTTTILHSLLQMRDFYLLLPVACCRRWFLGSGIRRATLQPKLSDLAAALCPPLLRKAQADHCLSILNIILLFLLLSTRSHAGISKPIQSGRTANNQLFGDAPIKELKKSTRKGKGNQW